MLTCMLTGRCMLMSSLKKEACSFWLMLLSPLLAFLLLSLFFISWFASVHSPLIAFPGLPCVVRPLELCPPVLVFLSVYSLSFVFVCPLFTSPVLWFFFSSVCVLSVFCDFSQLPKKTPLFSPPPSGFFVFFPRQVRSSTPFCGLFSDCPLFLPGK